MFAEGDRTDLTVTAPVVRDLDGLARLRVV